MRRNLRIDVRRTLVGLGLILVALLFSATSRAADEEGFKSLFNGADLKGWDGNPDFWSVRDGAITGQTTADKPTKGNTFLIWKEGKVSDFELRLSFKIIGGNSGIQYRSKDQGNWVVGGYQGDFEAGEKFSGILYEERGRGILAQRGEKTVVGKDGKVTVTGMVGDSKEIQSKIKKEDWNDYVIIAQGNHLIHKINGLTTVDVTDEQAEKRAMEGILALQLHAGPPMTVQFKNIRIKQVKAAALNAPPPAPQPRGLQVPVRLAAQEKAVQKKNVVLVAGRPSHGPGDHEHNAGVLLLKKCLDPIAGLNVTTHLNGWPKDAAAFDNADTILLYMDGGSGHAAIQGENLLQLNKRMKQGTGLVCVHYAVEVPKDRGGPEWLEWIGGYFEANWSVNPHWTAKFEKLPEHPITRGVKPFEINDEWYYHMRFRTDMEGVTPILTALPPESTLSRPDGTHSGNPAVREAIKNKMPQHVAWAAVRPDGGRGFGFTGAHFHRNWGDGNFRKIVLNAILWTAKVEVPSDGVSSTVTPEDLKANLDPKGKK